MAKRGLVVALGFLAVGTCVLWMAGDRRARGSLVSAHTQLQGQPAALVALDVQPSLRNDLVLHSPWANADLRVNPALLVHCAAWKAAASGGATDTGLGSVVDRAEAIMATDKSDSGKTTWLYVAAVLAILDDGVSTGERLDLLRSYFRRSLQDDDGVDLMGYLAALDQALDVQRARWCTQVADMDCAAKTVGAELSLGWPAALEFIASSYVGTTPANPTIACYVVSELPFEGGVNVLIPQPTSSRYGSVPTVILGTATADFHAPASVLMHEFVHVLDSFYHQPRLRATQSLRHESNQVQERGWQLEHVLVGAEGSLALRHVGLPSTGFWADPIAVCEVYGQSPGGVSNNDVVCVYDAWQAYRNGGKAGAVELLLQSLLVLE